MSFNAKAVFVSLNRVAILKKLSVKPEYFYNNRKVKKVLISFSVSQIYRFFCLYFIFYNYFYPNFSEENFIE
ncbi:hypothetical protein CCYN49044_130016 [Capnocytophaga cynodegmi]|uniref:Uncharacterized protein n=1 Tax=Capnocytophaga cynodegmi TaxID=28189 RepID=A0A0B7HPD3_9FLAO|nr:hypothetical protein CCYN49044_130016 [Capnocytophaga cynodegmi]CEN41596.1 hypothetical protein CCYN74_70061 [Capnocytophaga cynodegmi]